MQPVDPALAESACSTVKLLQTHTLPLVQEWLRLMTKVGAFKAQSVTSSSVLPSVSQHQCLLTRAYCKSQMQISACVPFHCGISHPHAGQLCCIRMIYLDHHRTRSTRLSLCRHMLASQAQSSMPGTMR